MSPTKTNPFLQTESHSTEAERTLIGALLIDPEKIMEIAPILAPNDFYDPIHGDIYHVMVDLYHNRRPVDFVTVSDALNKHERLGQIGGSAFIASLWLLPALNGHKSWRLFGQQIQSQVGAEALRSYGTWQWRSGAIYYTKRRIPRVLDFAELDEFWSGDRPVFLLVEQRRFDEVRTRVAPIEILCRTIGSKTWYLVSNRWPIERSASARRPDTGEANGETGFVGPIGEPGIDN